jgi:hypothetical protein
MGKEMVSKTTATAIHAVCVNEMKTAHHSLQITGLPTGKLPASQRVQRMQQQLSENSTHMI